MAFKLPYIGRSIKYYTFHVLGCSWAFRGILVLPPTALEGFLLLGPGGGRSTAKQSLSSPSQRTTRAGGDWCEMRGRAGLEKREVP